ncbi:MAG: hypothetical protein ACTHMY_12820 [Solirubrobacteraceae bacterium]
MDFEISTTAKLLLQVDLEGHSAWLRKADSKPAAVAARVLLAETLTKRLVELSFARVYWAGDGGMYARDATNLPSYDCVVVAAEAAADIFAGWAAEDADRNVLSIRISAHAAYPVYEHADSGYWTSDELNVFAKYERDIAIAGSIAITESVRLNLTPKYTPLFPAPASREVMAAGAGTDTALIGRVFYKVDSRARPLLHGTDSLAAYCEDLTGGAAPADGTQIGPRSAIRTTVAGASLLVGTESADGRVIIDFKRSPSSGNPLTASERAALRVRAEPIESSLQSRGLANMPMVSTDSITFPLLDLPCLVIQWHQEPWSHARAFHRLLDEDPGVRERLAPSAADLQRGVRRFPTILGSHVVATVRARSDERYVLLSQRNPFGPPDAYYPGYWSASLEEQLHVGETSEECVRRALAEELLGTDASRKIDLRHLGVFLERATLNVCILSLASLPMPYEELVRRWIRDAADRDENRQVIALPMRHEIVAELVHAGELTRDLRDECLVADRELFEQTSFWRLHPTSALRLIAALWTTESR